MNKNIVKSLIALLLVICIVIGAVSFLNNDKNDTNEEKINESNVINKNNLEYTYQSEIAFNEKEHIIKINYYFHGNNDSFNTISYDILIDDKIIFEDAGEYQLFYEMYDTVSYNDFIVDKSEYIKLPNEEDIVIINGSDNKEYLVIKMHDYTTLSKSIDSLFVMSETKGLAKLDFDMSFEIGSLEGESKEYYYGDEGFISQYLVESDKIRFLSTEDCDFEKETNNFIENILTINEDKAILEKRSTHVGSNFSGSNSCDDFSKVIIYE